MEKYQVSLEKFEGPLDLLLQLIEKEKLDIAEVSLTKVTDQFLEYLNNIEEKKPENLADFLVIASQLILIKSKSLLPNLEVSEEEKISTEELAWRLKEYKKFKDQAVELNNIYHDNKISFEQEFYLQKHTLFSPGKNVSLKNVAQAMELLVKNLDKFKALAKKTIRQTISIKEKILHLQEMISSRAEVEFKKVLKNAKNKLEAVVSFLALLELVKQQIIEVKQDQIFGEIIARKKQIN